MSFYLNRLGTDEKFYLCPNKNKVVIGRSVSCDIIFTSIYISRKHCEILRVPPHGTLIVKNLKGTNCTYVNELSLDEADACAELRVGYCIGLGVPLVHAEGSGIQNQNFVFLKLGCTQPSVEAQVGAVAEVEVRVPVVVGEHPETPVPAATPIPHHWDAVTPSPGTSTVSFPLPQLNGQGFRIPTSPDPQGSGLNPEPEPSVSSAPQAGPSCHTPSPQPDKEELSRHQIQSSVEDHLTTDNECASNKSDGEGVQEPGDAPRSQTERGEVIEITDDEEFSTKSSKLAPAEPDTLHPAASSEARDVEEPFSPLNFDLTQADPESPGGCGTGEDIMRDITCNGEVSGNICVGVDSLGSPLPGKRKRELNDECFPGKKVKTAVFSGSPWGEDSENEEQLVNKAVRKRPSLICDSDESDNLGVCVPVNNKINTSKNEIDVYSLFTSHSKKCTVNLVKLPNDVVETINEGAPISAYNSKLKSSPEKKHPNLSENKEDSSDSESDELPDLSIHSSSLLHSKPFKKPKDQLKRKKDCVEDQRTDPTKETGGGVVMKPTQPDQLHRDASHREVSDISPPNTHTNDIIALDNSINIDLPHASNNKFLGGAGAPASAYSSSIPSSSSVTHFTTGVRRESNDSAVPDRAKSKVPETIDPDCVIISHTEESRGEEVNVQRVTVKQEPGVSHEEAASRRALDKGEERDEMSIQKEITVKKEPGTSLEAGASRGEDDEDDEDDDGVVFMYSQVGEVIWLSSDEEEDSSPPPRIEDPAPPIPDDELEPIFMEDKEKHVSQDEEDAEKEDLAQEGNDQWDLVLSQSLRGSTDDSDMEAIAELKSTSPDNTSEPEPTAGPSGMSKGSPDTEEQSKLEEWRPQHSQGFFNEAEEEEASLGGSNSEVDGGARGAQGGPEDLQAIIKKVRGKDARSTQLTEPKMPVPTVRKRGRKCKGSAERDKVDGAPQAKGTVRKDRAADVGFISRSTEHKNSQTRPVTGSNKQKTKGSNLRKTLTSKFNLESYKATVENITKDKHHLVQKNEANSSKKPTTPQSLPCKTSHLIFDGPRANENLSIQKKSKPMKASPTANKDKPRPKVAAKVTKKSRFEKLIDIDIFSKPSSSKAVPNKASFKIPKHPMTGPSGSAATSCEARGGGLVLRGRRATNQVEGCPRPQSPSTLQPPPPQVASNSKNTQNETPDTSTASTTQKSNITNNLEQVRKGILSIKGDSHKSKLSKKIRFPHTEEELTKVHFIPSRTSYERYGPQQVRAREVRAPELLPNRQNDAEQSKSHNALPFPSYYKEEFIKTVCHWNYDWLDTYHHAQEKRKASSDYKVKPPPVVPSTNYPTLILYSSYKDYKETFSSLMYLELWETIYQDWIKSKSRNIGLHSLIEEIKPAFITTSTGVMKFWDIKFMVVLPQNQPRGLPGIREGSLLMLKVRKEAKKSIIFGYVVHVLRNRGNQVSNMVDKGCVGSLSLGVKVAREPIEAFKCGAAITISEVSYIRPTLRLWESLCKLPLSPLCQDILQPSPATFTCNSTTEYLIENMPLNDMQKRAVAQVSSKCMFDTQVPKLSLIHGPPGTGKTRTITALIAQMTKLGKKMGQTNWAPPCRVLMCAPSNAAVDELTVRLCRLREIGISLRVVRVGFKTSHIPQVRNCTLDYFVNKQMRMELSTPKCVSAREEWERRKTLVQEAADSLEMAMKENRSQGEIKQMEIRLAEMVRSKEVFERSFQNEPSVQERHRLHQKWQEEILLNAEVITTTLTGCLSGIMSEVFKKHANHFTCCIIDEAGQCKEMETLLPLLQGIRKMVLVGDHRQLPATVLSQLAQNKNLKQSLFERLHHRLVLELQREEVVHTLNVQYRMHPQIAEWPAHHFYMDKLITCPTLAMQSLSKLKPYLIFDLKTSQEEWQHYQEVYNPAEAALVSLLVQVVEPHLGQQKVGIITPYQRQKLHLEEKLAKFHDRIKLSINTIDGFQGQERDVIILSFVRANNSANIGFLSQRQRLNVALTRARKACYIVANLSSLEGNREWKSLIRNAQDRGLVHTVTKQDENSSSFISSIVLNGTVTPT